MLLFQFTPPSPSPTVSTSPFSKSVSPQMYRTDFWTLWEKARVGWAERTALKHVYYQVWNRSPAQVGWMRQVLGAGALGRPRGMGWGGRLEGSGWGTHVNPWLVHVNVWQIPLQYCKVISLQLIKINEKKNTRWWLLLLLLWKKVHLISNTRCVRFAETQMTYFHYKRLQNP